MSIKTCDKMWIWRSWFKLQIHVILSSHPSCYNDVAISFDLLIGKQRKCKYTLFWWNFMRLVIPIDLQDLHMWSRNLLWKNYIADISFLSLWFLFGNCFYVIFTSHSIMFLKVDKVTPLVFCHVSHSAVLFNLNKLFYAYFMSHSFGFPNNWQSDTTLGFLSCDA